MSLSPPPLLCVPTQWKGDKPWKQKRKYFHLSFSNDQCLIYHSSCYLIHWQSKKVQHEAQRPEDLLLLGSWKTKGGSLTSGGRSCNDTPPTTPPPTPSTPWCSNTAGHTEPRGQVLDAVHAQARQDLICNKSGPVVPWAIFSSTVLMTLQTLSQYFSIFIIFIILLLFIIYFSKCYSSSSYSDSYSDSDSNSPFSTSS